MRLSLTFYKGCELDFNYIKHNFLYTTVMRAVNKMQQKSYTELKWPKVSGPLHALLTVNLQNRHKILPDRQLKNNSTISLTLQL